MTRVSGGRQQILVVVTRLPVEVGDDLSVLDLECRVQEVDRCLPITITSRGSGRLQTS